MSDKRIEGAVNGRALRGEYVHNANTNGLYFVKQNHGDGRYDVKPVGRDEYATIELTGREWTFHPAPDLVVVTTRDVHGTVHTWRMGALPAHCPPDMIVRRALKRHWALYNVPNALVDVDTDWHWTSRSRNTTAGRATQQTGEAAA